MIVKAHVSTNVVGSKATFKVEFDDEELAGLTPEEREKYIEEAVTEELWNHIELGWVET